MLGLDIAYLRTKLYDCSFSQPFQNFAEIFGFRKLESAGYRAYCVILRLAAWVQCRLVTHGQTDARIDGHTTTAYTALA